MKHLEQRLSFLNSKLQVCDVFDQLITDKVMKLVVHHHLFFVVLPLYRRQNQDSGRGCLPNILCGKQFQRNVCRASVNIYIYLIVLCNLDV